MYDPEQITYFGEADARNRNVPFGIKASDRTRHVYVIGKTGMGKSTVLENMAVQDIQNDNGFAFIDPHGKTVDLLLEYIPPERVKDVLYFAPFDMEYPISFNIMEDVGYDKRHLVVSGLMAAFKKIWEDAWSARMEYILTNTLLALLEYPDATLLSVNKMLSDKNYRKKVVDNVQDTSVKSFWVDEFANYTERMAAEAVPAIQNKVGQFTANPLIRNIIGQPKSSFDIRQLMDTRKIFLINLSKGRIGESNANLLGSLLITKIYLSAMSRADVPEPVLDKELPNFYLYVDEFQSFANESFADILSEARKYKLNLTIAHQYIEQMSEEVRAAVFGNVGTMITFRVGSYDAEVLEKEFAPEFTAQDIVNLGRFQTYLRLMINGVGSKPFSARTLPPLERPQTSSVTAVLDNSRKIYGKPRAEVEQQVRELVEMGRVEKDDSKPQGKGQGGQKGGRDFGNNKKKGGGNKGGRFDNGGYGGGDNRGGRDGGDRSSGNFKESRKSAIDEKTKLELQALLAKHTVSDSDNKDVKKVENSDEVKMVEPEKQVNRSPKFVEPTLSPEDIKLEVQYEDFVPQREGDLIDFSNSGNGNSKSNDVDIVIDKPVKKTDSKKNNNGHQNMNDLNKKNRPPMDNDLKNDISPMMTVPPHRNDPKKVSSENKNQLAAALSAAMGEKRGEAKGGVEVNDGESKDSGRVENVSDNERSTSSLAPQMDTDINTMNNAINSVISAAGSGESGGAAEIESNSEVGAGESGPGSAIVNNSGATTSESSSKNIAPEKPKEIPENELRSILED